MACPEMYGFDDGSHPDRHVFGWRRPRAMTRCIDAIRDCTTPAAIKPFASDRKTIHLGQSGVESWTFRRWVYQQTRLGEGGVGAPLSEMRTTRHDDSLQASRIQTVLVRRLTFVSFICLRLRPCPASGIGFQFVRKNPLATVLYDARDQALQ